MGKVTSRERYELRLSRSFRSVMYALNGAIEEGNEYASEALTGVLDVIVDLQSQSLRSNRVGASRVSYGPQPEAS